MTIKKNDFVEIEFTGKFNGNIFDTTDRKKAKEIGLDADIKPIIVSVGNQMLLKGFDSSLEGKEIGKNYSVHLKPEDAFGKRQPSLIKIMPKKVFIERNINPVQGMTVQLDNYIARILSASGGRIITDFNNPLAGKEIDYDFIIKRNVEDDKEKINALQDFFFKKRFDFSIEGKKVIFKDEKIKPFLEMLKEKFKEMTGFEFEVARREKKESKGKIKEEKKNE
jgi:FKBP-type peptidyl-prolyl cis-trans isomerase SlyD